MSRLAGQTIYWKKTDHEAEPSRCLMLFDGLVYHGIQIGRILVSYKSSKMYNKNNTYVIDVFDKESEPTNNIDF